MFHENDDFTKNRLKEFKKNENNLNNIYLKYYNKFDELMEDAKQKSKSLKFGIGSYLMHRGYFCPNPVDEIIVGNCKRGRLTNKLGKKNKDYYIYHFDGNDRLICSVKYADNLLRNREFILRDDKIEYSLDFSISQAISNRGLARLSIITKSIYSGGLLKKYFLGGIPPRIAQNDTLRVDSLDSFLFFYDTTNRLGYVDYSFGVNTEKLTYREDRIKLFYGEDNHIVRNESTLLSRSVQHELLDLLKEIEK